MIKINSRRNDKDKITEEYIDKLREKIELQDSVIKMKDDEINKYKNILKDLGVQIDESFKQAERVNYYDKPSTIVVKQTRLYLNKCFAIDDSLHKKLELINSILKQY